MVMDGSDKIPISLAFSKLVLDDVKVEILLILWHFLFFSLRPPPVHSLTPSFFFDIKGVQVVYIWAKFHLCLICSSRVLKFQMFSYQQKVQF